MIDTEFDFDICCRGVSWDKQEGYNDDDVRVTKYYRIDTLMFRASPEMLHEWRTSHEHVDIYDFETQEEYNRHVDRKNEEQWAWQCKVCDMLRWEPLHVCITNHMAEIFSVSKIEEVKVEEYGG